MGETMMCRYRAQSAFRWAIAVSALAFCHSAVAEGLPEVKRADDNKVPEGATPLTPEDLAGLTAPGAVGDIAGRIITVDGELHANAFDDRIIGVSFEQLHHIPKTLAVAAGVEKTDAIRGTLHAGIVNILCTDDRTASAVLAMERQNGN